MLIFAAFTAADELSFVPAGETKPEPYLLEQPTTLSPKGKHPLLIYLHGHGQDHKVQWLSEPFAEFRRLAHERGYFILVPHLGKASWMNARARRVLDELLERVISQHPVDPSRLYTMGMSMGGGAALTYAVHAKRAIAAVCDLFGTTDFVALHQAGRYARSLEAAFGGTPDQVPEVYRRQSALCHLDAFQATPVFVVHGREDAAISVEQSRRFVEAMRSAGLRVEYHEVPERRHERSLIRGCETKILDFFAGAKPPPRTTAADRNAVSELPR